MNRIAVLGAGNMGAALIGGILNDKQMPVFRAMPNIPVVVEEGATAVAGPAEKRVRGLNSPPYRGG
jgi:pyrroline-5-carboxylate reductase